MHPLLRPLMLAALTAAIAATALPAQAGLFDRNPQKLAEDAAREDLAAVTIWVDVTWGFRTQGAANNLNKAHQAFAERGYRVHSVEPYVENSDLEGFFVTYQRPRTP